ncbi:MAG TPA: metal ABC transporter permease [Spirochaetota bacterium]|nr:metal ABC transporter permease [Spirochaetota bacterium]HOL57918.1 metal ABC transporter permease [Spirochaetota bacterium]HPP03848.1 metal ABC transporter permease [Spirochaetota bacterium]
MEIFILLQKAILYDFIQKALICGTLIAITSSLLGNFLVLKKQSLISDGLSHVSFATIAISLFLGLPPLFVSIPLVIFASILINRLGEKTNVYSDSAIGLVSAFSIAIGVIIVSINKGFNIDIYSYLFGSILSISFEEIILTLIVSIISIILLILFLNDLFLVTYDQDFASVSKINTKILNIIIGIIQSIIIVVGIKIVGAMLMSSLIIFPPITALQIAKNFKSMIIISLILSVTSVITGIFLSFIFNLPTGATIVVINGIFFIISFFLNKIEKIK